MGYARVPNEAISFADNCGIQAEAPHLQPQSRPHTNTPKCVGVMDVPLHKDALHICRQAVQYTHRGSIIISSSNDSFRHRADCVDNRGNRFEQSTTWSQTTSQCLIVAPMMAHATGFDWRDMTSFTMNNNRLSPPKTNTPGT